MFKKIPFILLAIIIVVMLFGKTIPTDIKSFFYTTSLSIKTIIVFILPIIIFSLLFKTAVNLANNATKIIGLVIICVCFSNFISTFLSHYVGIIVYNFDLSIIRPQSSNTLKEMWNLELPKLVENSNAIFGGIILGILITKCNQNLAVKISQKLDYIIEIILKCLIYMIPLFIVGFVLKLEDDNVIGVILKDYSIIFLVITMSQVFYLGIAYLLFNHFNLRDFCSSVKNMIPAVITGFSTMSSVAAMPFTIIGVQNNAKHKELARSVIPATVNIHLVGDCIAIPILAYAILKNYGMAEPSFINYIIFSLYFVLAKFSVAAIPGGGIIVMIPILESYLGFNNEMTSLITALYILFDPVITCVNVFGNGAFAKAIEKFWSLIICDERKI